MMLQRTAVVKALACVVSRRSVSRSAIAAASTTLVSNSATFPQWRGTTVMRFSSNVSSSDDNASAPPTTNVMDENRFMELADTTLHDILNWLDGVEEMLEESDISFAQGVLKIDLGEHGTWVLNRQIPNRQIWWSSPRSGPRRYEYDAANNTWLNTRDGTEMMELLRSEILEATGIEIYE